MIHGPRPLAAVGTVDIPTKPYACETPLRQGVEHLSIAIQQMVEADFWDTVARWCREEDDADQAAVQNALRAVRGDAPIPRYRIRPEYDARRDQVQLSVAAIRDPNVRDVIERAMAESHVREGIALRLLPAEITFQHSEHTRELLLTTLRDAPRIVTASDRPPNQTVLTTNIDITPQRDGLVLSSTSAFSEYGTLLSITRWPELTTVIDSIRAPLAEARLITPNAQWRMRRAAEGLNTQLHALKAEFTNWPLPPPLLSPPPAPAPTWQRAISAVTLGWYTAGKKAPPRPEPALSKPEEVEAVGRQAMRERLTEWVQALHEGLNQDQLKRFLR